MGNPRCSRVSSKMAPATRPAVEQCAAIRPATYPAALKDFLGTLLEDGREVAAVEGGREAAAVLTTGTMGGSDLRLATSPRDETLEAGGLALRSPSGTEILGGGGGLVLGGGAPGARPEEAVGAAPSAARIAPEAVRPREADGGPPGKNNRKGD